MSRLKYECSYCDETEKLFNYYPFEGDLQRSGLVCPKCAEERDMEQPQLVRKTMAGEIVEVKS